MPIAADDPALVAAAEEARRRWPEFVHEFQNHRNANTAFAVKLAFPLVAPGTGHEHMWIQVHDISGQTIRGSLDNEPRQNVGLKLGDEVAATADRIDDRMIDRGKDNIKGLFSYEAMKRKHEERQRR